MLREVGHRVRFVGHAEHADILIWSPNTTKRSSDRFCTWM